MNFPVGDPQAKKHVGYLPENPAFYDFLTAREYLRFVGQVFSMEAQRLAVETARVLELLDLHQAADRPIRGFSKGMVQRLGMAQALLHDPDLYILDEPMSGLDPMGRALVKEIIKDLKQRGKSVFFSTHITADVEVVCDRVGIVSGGQLLACDNVASILEGGIEGYEVQVNRADGTTDEFFSDRSVLEETLRAIWAQGATIQRIEPKRKGLEAFFLDVIARARHESE
jgi:ABC-2 type transport system ATP-binding protein